MFGVGWTEMLLVGVVALVVIGPKDLPVVMSRLGKMVATIRRLGTEFQREINKTTGLDQITDLRRSITEPLKSVTDEITRDFNRVTSTGTTEPTGIIAPKVAGSESVADEIKEKVGMTPPAPTSPASTPVIAAAAATPAAHVESPAPAEAIAPVAVPAKKAARKPRARKAAAAETAPVVEASGGRKALASADAAPKPARKARPKKPQADA